MFTTVKNAFKIKEIRNKVFFTFLMLVVIRLGSQLPVPGVDRHYFSNWFTQQTGDAFNFLDAFTGGSFLNMSILALNITPYITSSIIMQLLTIAIPKLEEMQRDGEDGRKKIASITRYVTVACISYVDWRTDYGEWDRQRNINRACYQYHFPFAAGYQSIICTVRIW